MPESEFGPLRNSRLQLCLNEIVNIKFVPILFVSNGVLIKQSFVGICICYTTHEVSKHNVLNLFLN